MSYTVNPNQLKTILQGYHHDDATIQQITDSLNQTFAKYNINTKLRVQHFLAQALHESGGFVFLKEIWGPTEQQKKYDNRPDMGNIHPGDGFKYRGRGLFQLTWEVNYAKISKDLNVDFVTNPDLIATYPYAVISAGWFWNNHNLNSLADLDDLTKITHVINGGLNGFDQRKAWLDKLKTILL